ncbi:MAG TPA: ATP-binding protein [Methanocellales archaeon]|nr:ATP-binding protein [Methanocellales archaeon]
MDREVKSLLIYLDAAIRADDLAGICALANAKPDVAPLLRADFFLHDFAELLFQVLQETSEGIQVYLDDTTKRTALKKCMENLTRAQERIAKMNLFDRCVLERVFSNWRMAMQVAFDQFHPISNPYVPGVPLVANSPVFVGRAETFRFIQDNLHNQTQKNALILHGGWHTGKTSILFQIESGMHGQQLRERHNRPVYPVFIDLQVPVGSIYEFLVRLAYSIKKSLNKRSIRCPQPVDDNFKTEPYLAFDRFLDEVVQAITKRADGLLVLMLDEFEILDKIVSQGKIDGEVFRYLRSIMQNQRSVTFILAGRHGLDEMTPEYQNIISNVALHHEVGFLTPKDARDLICKTMEASDVTYEDAVVERILRLSGDHPLFIQQLCFNCIDLLNSSKQDYRITESLLECALESALRHNMVLESLWGEKICIDDKAVLRILAELHDDTGTGIPFSTIVLQSGMSNEQVNQSLEILCKLQLITQQQPESGGEMYYRYHIDMLRLWVAQQ